MANSSVHPAERVSDRGRRPPAAFAVLSRRWSLLAAIWLMHALAAGGIQAREVVVVKSSDAEPYTQAETALRDELVKQNHTVRVMLAKEVSDRGIDATIGKADVVVTIGTPAARWLQKQLPPRIELMAYCMVNNAEDAGLLKGRTSWGVTTDVPIEAQFKLITETLPRARSVGTLYRSETPEGRATLQQLKNAVPKEWRVEAVAVNDYPSVAAAIDALSQKGVDLIWTTADQKLYDTASVRALLLAALRSKTPVWGFSTAFVRAGALLGVGVEPRAQGTQAAALIIKLLNDPKAVRDRVQSPAEFQIAINLIVAEQLGLEIPDALMRRANYVFRPEK
jgi:putative tryptophan/tyrosine transport system substrate-binding protein